MQWRVDTEQLHTWWRVLFGGFLVLALVVGLWLSFRPGEFEDEPQVAGNTEPTQAPAEEEPAEPADGAEEPPEDDGEAEEEPTEDPGLTEEEREELIAAARSPGETSVQVLDAGGGSTATSDVAQVLRDEGYDVVAVNSSRVDYDVTTVLFTDGNEAEAEALRARDDRFSAVAANERLSEGVDLHVVVGPDWSG